MDLRLILLLILSLKTCTMCGAMKLLTEFYPNRLGRFGRAARCKVCVLRRKKRQYATNKMVLSPVKIEMVEATA